MIDTASIPQPNAMKTKITQHLLLIQAEFDFSTPVPVAPVYEDESNLTPEQVLKKWTPLAYQVTANWNIPGYDREDLHQEALIAIHKCSLVHDRSKSIFYTMAKRAINNRMTNLLVYANRKKRTTEATVVSLDAEIANTGLELHEIVGAESEDFSTEEVTEIVNRFLSTNASRLKRRAVIAPAEFNADLRASLASAASAYGIKIDFATARKTIQSARTNKQTKKKAAA